MLLDVCAKSLRLSNAIQARSSQVQLKGLNCDSFRGGLSLLLNLLITEILRRTLSLRQPVELSLAAIQKAKLCN